MAKRHLLSPLTILILLLAACPLAHAAPNLPPGPYAASCPGIELRGATLVGHCTDFFGNQHNTSLPNAPACAADKHTITNVNGDLRCVVWAEPNQGIVSVPVDKKDSESETKVWRIDQPIVNDPNPFGYDFVKFKSGDMVSISAGGCVQTGGSGRTWKSYTVPTGDNADHLYSGTISIPGVIGSIQRIGGVLAPQEWVVPRDLPPTVLPQLHLIIGYQDDGYGDNGYYAHDDGNNDQCKNVGPAWIQVRIVSDLTLSKEPKNTPFSKPFDLTWDTTAGVDANGLPLNPSWGFQVQHPGQFPDFQKTCGSAISNDTWPATGSNINVSTLAANCTSQSPTSDLSTNSFDMFFTICRPSGFLYPGHLNWAIATYTGNIWWNEYSGDWPSDGDYNFNLFPPGDSGLTDNEQGLGLEFKGGETIDNLSNPFWKDTVASQDAGRIGKAINSHLAVVTGLIGMDAVHGGYTESHPVYAMAIEVSEATKGDTIDQHWVYFLRNSGNEGGCSHMDHFWPGLGGAYFVSFPWPSSKVTSVKFENSQFSRDEAKAVSGGHGIYPGWSFLKFQFPNDSTEIDGTVTVHYTLAAGAKRTVLGGSPKPGAHVHEEDEPDFKEIAARITEPALREQFLLDLAKAKPPVKKTPQKRVAVVVDNAVTEHNPPRLAGQKGELTRDKPAESPVKKAEADATKPLVEKYRVKFTPPEIVAK